jgi:anti-anti-sigma regulatory factor
MGRAARIVTMWTGHHQVHERLYGEADTDADLVARLDVILSQVLQVGATHLVVHLDRLIGDDTAVVAVLTSTCQQLWLRRGVMEIVGMRDSHTAVSSSRNAPVRGSVRAAPAPADHSRREGDNEMDHRPQHNDP